MTTNVLLYGYFTAGKLGKSGLSDVVVDVDAIAKATGLRTEVVTGSAASSGRRGYYYYWLPDAAPETHDYIAIFVTADASVDANEVAAVRPDLAEAWRAALVLLDAPISTRLAGDAYQPPSPAADTADAVRMALIPELAQLDAPVSSRLATIAYTAPPSGATVAAAVRSELAPEVGRLDAPVSSRLASSAYQPPPDAATMADAVRTELAPELGRLDVAASSRLATTAYAPPPAVADAVRAELALELTRLDVPVSSRLAGAVYAPPLNSSGVQAAAAQALLAYDAATGMDLAALPAPPSGGALAAAVRTELAPELGRLDVAVSTRLAATSHHAAPDAAAVADAVWEELLSEHTTPERQRPLWLPSRYLTCRCRQRKAYRRRPSETPMALTLADYRERVRSVLATALDASTWTDALIDAGLRSALLYLAERLPPVEATLACAAGRTQPLTTLPDLLTIAAIGWPWQANEEIFHAARWRWASNAAIHIESGVPAAGDLLRLRYWRRLAVSGLEGATATTLPDRHADLVATGAAGYALLGRVRQVGENPAVPKDAARTYVQVAGDLIARFSDGCRLLDGTASTPAWTQIGV
ncbi:MAG: hypothetical protein IPM07_25000 [Anaerolineales bacterium]|nr:hypothetical protein [Anaerolineales bacterium]